MKRKLLVSILFLTQLALIIPNSAEAKMTCSQVTLQTKKLFEKEYKGESDKALLFLAENIVKAYKLTLDNSKCFSKKEISDMKNQIRTMKSDCLKAKEDELTWMLQKDMCAVYPALYKYIK